MRTQSQRGRAVRAHHGSNLRPFYILLALIAIVGVAALATVGLRARQSSAPGGAALDRPSLSAPTGRTPDGYYYKGQPDAAVTVVEYSDFECPYCGRFATGLALAIDRDYVETGKIRYIFHDYPLPKHANAIAASEAARCAGDQNAFWPMHDTLFANQAQWSESAQPLPQFGAYAKQLKLDGAAFTQCMNNGKYTAAIRQAQQDSNQAQIPGTPTFVIDGKQYDSSQLQGAIDAALAAKR
jgi:protein-disulfide isomerase